MSIQPLSNRPRELSVTEAIEPAYERAKLMLFSPFNFSKWIAIGFCAWLAGLGEYGGGGFNGYGGGNGNRGSTHSGDDFNRYYHQATDFVMVNLGWIIPVAVLVVLLILALWVLLIWLSSRGKFMFLYCVVWDRAEIESPWSQYAQAGNSLFWFRLAVGLAGMVLILPLLVFVAVNIIQMVKQGEPEFAGIMLCIGLGLVVLFLIIVFGIIHKFQEDFVVPIMFLRNGSCLAAWREFWVVVQFQSRRLTISFKVQT